MGEAVNGGDIIGAVLPVLGLAINWMAQVWLVRMYDGKNLLKSVFAGFAIGLLAVVAIEFALFVIWPQPILELLGRAMASLLAYGALGYCYFHFINLGETARRIRIMRELSQSEEGLTLEQLLEKYNARKMIEKRLARLIHTGQIVDREGRYFIGNPSVLRMAQIIETMKWIVLGKKSEFD